MDKIIYITIEEHPPRPTDRQYLDPSLHPMLSEEDFDSFWRETYQRLVVRNFLRDRANGSSQYPKLSLDHTLVLCGDTDEIVNRDELNKFRDLQKVFPLTSDSVTTLSESIFSNGRRTHFLMTHFYYNFNWCLAPAWYQCFLTDLNTYLQITDFLTWRCYTNPGNYFVPFGGWHLGYFTKIADIQRKIESMAHRQHDHFDKKEKENLKERIRRGKILEDSQLIPFDTSRHAELLPQGWEDIQKMMIELQELDEWIPPKTVEGLPHYDYDVMSL